MQNHEYVIAKQGYTIQISEAIGLVERKFWHFFAPYYSAQKSKLTPRNLAKFGPYP